MPVYRQITHKLRLQYGPGKPDIVSERPSRRNREGRRVYTDSDDNPTLVELTGAEVGCDVEMLIAQNAIQPYTPPKGRAKVRNPTVDLPHFGGDDDGKPAFADPEEVS